MGMAKIREIRMGDGNKIPELGLGTWQLTGNRCKEAVKGALELGYKHIDTAEAYGNEKEIGDAIAGFERKKLFITSKVWPYRNRQEKIVKACEDSISRLGSDYIDLYLLHWPSSVMNLEDVFKAFKKLKDDGLVKSVGVSNFMASNMRNALEIAMKNGVKIANNQVEFHPFLNQRMLLESCNKNNVAVTAYSPLARGKVFREVIIKGVAAKYGKTAGQVSIRWLLQKGMAVIPKASSREHMAENIDVYDFKISNNDMKRLDYVGEIDVEINGILDYAFRAVKRRLL